MTIIAVLTLVMSAACTVSAQTALPDKTAPQQGNVLNADAGAIQQPTANSQHRALQACALTDAERDEPFASLHVGLLANPKIGFTFGLDLTLPRVRLFPGFTTRLDADVLAPFDVPSFLGQPGTQVDVTFNQSLYGKGRVGKRFYGGAGLGVFYYHQVYQFGGKLYVGQEFTPIVGLEVGLHIPAASTSQLTAQLRIAL